MDKKQIKTELGKRGYDLSMLAEAIHKSPSLVSKVLARQARSRVVAIAVARALEKKVEEVFPDVPEYQNQVPVESSERAAKIETLRERLSGKD